MFQIFNFKPSIFCIKGWPKGTPQQPTYTPDVHHNMIRQCYVLKFLLRERPLICSIWVYQQVGICTDVMVIYLI